MLDLLITVQRRKQELTVQLSSREAESDGYKFTAICRPWCRGTPLLSIDPGCHFDDEHVFSIHLRSTSKAPTLCQSCQEHRFNYHACSVHSQENVLQRLEYEAEPPVLL
ncbi:hypothetical protein XENORESO_003182 [Xenotaenia resolanae]|uniref:Uncharacterized protein n=1 Tax=Xenotaenia resolanae TaxID=208358 RepID=A0ABV0VWX4_9TELE